MRIPVVSWLWDLSTSVVWDTAVNVVEMSSLAGRRWWWRLHLSAARQFWLDPPARVVVREGPALGLPAGQLVYGETPVLTYLTLMRLAEIDEEDVVYDLGCGRALGLMATALEYRVQARGVEIVPTLVARAAAMGEALGLAGRVRFIEGDFVAQDLSDATIVYVASTTFTSGVMSALTQVLAEVAQTRRDAGLRPLRVYTLTRRLGLPFRLVWQRRYPMTWGWATVHLQELAPPLEDDGADSTED